MNVFTRGAIVAAVLLSAPSPASADVAVHVRAGGWSDVVKSRAGFELLRATQTEVVREHADGRVIWQVRLPEPMLYLRAAIDPHDDTVEAIAQGNHSGLAYVIRQSGVTAIGPSFGQNATAISWSAGAAFRYYVQTSPTTYAVYDRADRAPVTFTMAATSQGFRDIVDDQVRRGDDTMTATVLGRQLWSYAQRGDITVGQCDPPGICAVAGGRVFTVVTGNAFEPHLVVDGATFAIATRTEFGATLAIVSPPYPPADVHGPGTAPEPAPGPDPVPPAPPEPQTLTAPNARATVAAVIAAHPEIDSCDEDRRGAIVDYAAQRLNKQFGLVWGRKSRNAQGTDLNTDGLTFKRPDGRFEIYDVISGAGACGATWDGFGPFASGENGFGVPPQLGPEPTAGAGPVTPPQPLPPTAAGVTRAELDAAIAAASAELLGQVNEARVAIADLDRRLSARLEAVKPVDLVALQAAIDAALANYEVAGKTATDRLGLQHVVKLAITKRKQ